MITDRNFRKTSEKLQEKLNTLLSKLNTILSANAGIPVFAKNIHTNSYIIYRRDKMAKIDTLNTPNIAFDKFINVSNSVGRNGANALGDVLVVQALLKYAVEERRGFSHIRFPIPTGKIDNFTIQAIKQYQRQKRRYFPKFPVDGRIDPARGNAIKWTIGLLNGDAYETWLLTGQNRDNYILEIADYCPQIKSVLPVIPVGTLGLTLEPSKRAFGSLNLGLE